MGGKVLLFGDTGQLLHELDHDGKVLIHPGRNLHPLRRRSSNRNRLAHDALDLLQRCLAEMDIACRGGLLKLSRSVRSDNGYINRRLGKHPRNS